MRPLPLERCRAVSLVAFFVDLGLVGCASTSHVPPPAFAPLPIACVRGTTVDFATGTAFWSGIWAVQDAPPYLSALSPGFHFLAALDGDPQAHRQLFFQIRVIGPAREARQVRVTMTNIRSAEDSRAALDLEEREFAAEISSGAGSPRSGAVAPPDIRTAQGAPVTTPAATEEQIARIERSLAEFQWAPTPSGMMTLPLRTPGDARALRLTLEAAPGHICERPSGMLAALPQPLNAEVALTSQRRPFRGW